MAGHADALDDPFTPSWQPVPEKAPADTRPDAGIITETNDEDAFTVHLGSCGGHHPCMHHSPRMHAVVCGGAVSGMMAPSRDDDRNLRSFADNISLGLSDISNLSTFEEEGAASGGSAGCMIYDIYACV